MPGSKSSKSSTLPGPKPSDVPAPTSYSQTTVSDSTRIDLLNRDVTILKDDFTTMKSEISGIHDAIRNPSDLISKKPSSTSATAPPKQEEDLSDVSSLTKPTKQVSFDLSAIQYHFPRQRM